MSVFANAYVTPNFDAECRPISQLMTKRDPLFTDNGLVSVDTIGHRGSFATRCRQIDTPPPLKTKQSTNIPKQFSTPFLRGNGAKTTVTLQKHRREEKSRHAACCI